ncbi:hypothetical protein L207DRAFT_190766 [Hyaloscypha variabilis F]|uniref:Transferase family protein n=1 Tax=Hyaloscypha variabilis (strain UAMH 11265 / GT02V1 / F) TaxID=1149755 RepID=A0A2J6QZF4_HYAVF|nr:hypothetical protein L207DRAFT_190766 [Hyaloscypha variabilis F]
MDGLSMWSPEKAWGPSAGSSRFTFVIMHLFDRRFFLSFTQQLSMLVTNTHLQYFEGSMAHHEPITKYSPKTTNPVAKDLTVFVGLVVSGVLDIGVLESAARELVEQWQMLGGTLIRTTKSFSLVSGDIVDFESRTINKTLQTYFPVDFHVEKSNIPTYKAQPQGNGADKCFHFDSFRPLNLLPKNLLTVRVTCLNDATLLGFRVPHHFCDGESVYHVIKAFRDIVAGQKIKTLINCPDVDQPLSLLLGKETKFPIHEFELDDAPYLHPRGKLLAGIGPWVHYVGYAISRMIGAKIGITQKSEEKLIHLPGALVEHWRTECQKELEQTIDQTIMRIPTLSKLDIITAWFLHTSLSRVPGDNGSLDLMYNFSYRFALPSSAPNEVYLKNTYYELRIHWPSLSSFQTATLASLALRIRTSVLLSKQPEIIKSNLEFQEQHITELVAPGGKDMRLGFLPFLSSWAAFEYNALDFSMGLKGGRKLGGDEGRVVFTLPRVALPLGIMVDPLAVVLKDGEGGYWLRANLSKMGWEGHLQ